MAELDSAGFGDYLPKDLPPVLQRHVAEVVAVKVEHQNSLSLDYSRVGSML